MSDTHSLKNTVVAVFESRENATAAVDDLAAKGLDYEVLQGEAGSEHLDPGGEGGLWAAMKRMATALGDENRVLDRLDKEIAEGNVVVSVDIEDAGDERSSAAVAVLRENGGRFIWKFGEWAFTPIEI